MTTPLCPFFNSCGGCSAQHVEYEVQVENKRKFLAQAIGYKDVKAFSGEPYFYRNRMDFVFHQNGLGLREKEKWYHTVDIDRCVISTERLNTLIKEIRLFFKDVDAFDTRQKLGTFRYAVIRTPKNDSGISFVFNKDSLRVKEAIEQVRTFAETSSAKNIVVTSVSADTDMSVGEDETVIKGSVYLKETLLGKEFVFPIQGFFQNNSAVAEMMQGYVHAILKEYKTREAHLLDLYGGVGTFGIINAPLFKSSTIIESVAPAIKAANENIKMNNITNAKAVALDAMQLKKVDLSSPLYVITDPPRTGMHIKTIQRLNELKPAVIVYISCNPQQLAKEIPRFNNYTIKSAAMFDLFPQTPHSEAIVELVRRN
jgi:23S rRNA (uracil-5-)-methyltransferase RumA